MADFNELQQKIRRSSALKQFDLFQDYLEYASKCRDELEVLSYMEQNKIGTDRVQFWLSFLTALKHACQYKQICQTIHKIENNHKILQPSQLWKIADFQENLIYDLQKQIRQKRGRRRRSTQEFVMFSISKIQKHNRKVGGIQIYVDQDCRSNYKLDDYTDFFVRNMKSQCSQIRLQYENSRISKPLSFLGLKRLNLENLSKQLIEPNKRNSLTLKDEPKTMLHQINRRFSISRKSNMHINPELYFETPKNQKQVQQNSVSNLKSIVNRKSIVNFATPKIAKSTKQLEQQQILLTKAIKQKKSKKLIKEDFYDEELQTSQDNYNFDDLIQAQRFYISPLQSQFFKHQLQQSQSKHKYQQQFHQNHQNNIGFYLDSQQIQQCSKSINTLNEIYQHNSQYMAQINRQYLNKSFLHELYQKNNEEKAIQQFISLKLASTHTFESVDSNQQNKFSNEKITKQNTQQIDTNNKFIKKQRKAFNELKQSDLQKISNIDSSSLYDQQIQNVSDDETQLLVQLIQAIQNEAQTDRFVTYEKQTQNIVLQKLRQNKLNQILESYKCVNKNQITHSQKRRYNRQSLHYISQQKSYNSQRKGSILLESKRLMQQFQDQEKSNSVQNKL